MAAIESLREVALAARHMDDACALVAEARWNQTPDDWRLMMDAGDAIGLEDAGGRLVASALCMPYGSAFGWVSMVLVTADRRRQGIATRLLNTCVERHLAAGRVPVLDATPDGEKVYDKLGFEPVFPIRRWQRQARPSTACTAIGIRPAAAADTDQILRHDHDVFGGDRSAVLRDLLTREGAAAWIADDGSGFLLSRKGRTARQIGPLCAQGETTATRLLSHALSAVEEPIYIDVPDRHAGIVDLLQEHGFVEQRPFQRMQKGAAGVFGDPARMYAISGPELG